jgi:hypothetical protein
MRDFEYDTIYGTNIHRLQINGALTDEAIQEILKSNFDLLWLWGDDFQKLNDIDLSKTKFTRLNLFSRKTQDVSWIGNLSSLAGITMKGKTKGNIIFDNLINLNFCDFETTKATREVVYSSLELESLSLNRLDVPLSDFNKKLATSLKIFGFSGNKFENLDGIEAFSNLESIEIENSKSLVDISKLSSLKILKHTGFEGVNNIENLNVLGEISSLEGLVFNCKILPSLKLLLPALNLKTIELGDNTVIDDRDVEIALEFPKLEYMIFAKKKGYAYDAEQLEEAIKQKRSSA